MQSGMETICLHSVKRKSIDCLNNALIILHIARHLLLLCTVVALHKIVAVTARSPIGEDTPNKTSLDGMDIWTYTATYCRVYFITHALKRMRSNDACSKKDTGMDS